MLCCTHCILSSGSCTDWRRNHGFWLCGCIHNTNTNTFPKADAHGQNVQLWQSPRLCQTTIEKARYQINSHLERSVCSWKQKCLYTNTNTISSSTCKIFGTNIFKSIVSLIQRIYSSVQVQSASSAQLTECTSFTLNRRWIYVIFHYFTWEWMFYHEMRFTLEKIQLFTSKLRLFAKRLRILLSYMEIVEFQSKLKKKMLH